MNNNLIFSSIIFPGSRSEITSMLLAESIRAFGGRFSSNPIWLTVPGGVEKLTPRVKKRLQELDVQFFSFFIEKEQAQIFFLEQLQGLALIEKISENETDLLVWMDANTLLLNEPKEFILPAESNFGYCPVHLLLLGSRFDLPLDPFWSQIYQVCQVRSENIFAMQPMVENLQMRPYFNAGQIVVRPGRALLRRWFEIFVKLYSAREFYPFYQQDERYTIFMHQAVLAGVAMNYLERQEMLELPHTYNYPMHLHSQDQTAHRPLTMDGLITVRHEGFYREKDWKNNLPVSERTRQWLSDRITEYSSNDES